MPHRQRGCRPHLQARKQREAELAAAGAIEETEDADDQSAAAAAPGPVTDAAEQQPQPSSKGLLPAGLTIPKRPAVVAPGSTAAAAASAAQEMKASGSSGSGGGPASSAAGPVPPAAAPAANQPAASAPAGQPPAEAPAAPAAGLEVRPKRLKTEAGGDTASPQGSHAAAAGHAGGQSPPTGNSGPRLLSRAQLVAQQQQQRHAAGLAADLDALARARHGAAAQAEVRPSMSGILIMSCPEHLRLNEMHRTKHKAARVVGQNDW